MSEQRVRTLFSFDLREIMMSTISVRRSANGFAEFDQCDPTTFFTTHVDLDTPGKRGVATCALHAAAVPRHVE